MITHDVRESCACADRFTFAHAVCETATSRCKRNKKASFTLRLKKYIILMWESADLPASEI